MIVCSCTLISERDIERAVAEIMSGSAALLPTPGIVFRHLNKQMNCCSCAPLTVDLIYSAMTRLQSDTRVCPFALVEARQKLVVLEERRQSRKAARAARDEALREIRAV